MKTRAALSIVVSLLALLPSLSGQNNNHTRSNAYQYVETTIGAPAYRAEQVYGAKPVNRTRRQTTASETAASADSVYETSTGYVIYVNETGADSDSHAIRTSSSGYSSENGGVPSNLPTDRNDVNIPRPFRECRNDEFRCGSNECVPASARCDNKIDCRDSSDEESCITNGCTLPQQPEGGRYTVGGCGEPCYKNPGDIVPKNTILTYNCTEKYFLKGNTVSICLNEDWIAPPSCLRICSALRSTSVDISCSYQGETVSCTERVLPGTQARLSCKSSHTLHITNDPGYRNIVCINDGYWNRPLFRCLPECGISTPQGSPTIVNGSEAKVGTFPWHVGIYRKNNDTEYEQICGGSLINNNLVISAAHCFYNDANNKLHDASRYAVAGGKRYRAWNVGEEYSQNSTVEYIHLTRRYQGQRGNFAEDIALVKMKTPFQLSALVLPICIDWHNVERDELRAGQAGKVVGWGRNIHGESTPILHEIDLPYVPFQECERAVPVDFRGYLTPDKFCAGHLNAGSGVCDGDSGGGLCFQKEEDRLWYIRGIVSVSPIKNDTCDYNKYTAFTSVTNFRDWILEAYVNS